MQCSRMVRYVFADKTGDEIVAVIISRVQAQSQRVSGGLTRGLEQFRFELFGQKFIGLTLIDQQR